MILPLQRWHDHPSGVSLEDAFLLVSFMPEWDWMRDDARVQTLLEGLPSHCREHEFRLSKKPMLSKRAVSDAVARSHVSCQTCGRKMVWSIRHTDKQNRGLSEIRRFNSDIFDALAGQTHVAVCSWCAKRYQEEPELFLARLLTKEARAMTPTPLPQESPALSPPLAEPLQGAQSASPMTPKGPTP